MKTQATIIALAAALCAMAVPIPSQSQSDVDHLQENFDSYGLGIPLLAFYVSDPSPLWEGFGSYRELQAHRRAQRLANLDARCPTPVGGSLIALAQWELKYAKCRLNNAIKAGAGDTDKRMQAVVAAQKKLFAAQRRGHGYDVNGKKHGRWIERQPNGDVFEGPYVEGKMHGDWVMRYAGGGVQEGTYRWGKRHDHWVLRFADGRVEEGPFVNGKRHGDWVFRRADGGVQEGPYVNGKQHGDWVLRGADGGVHEGPIVDGKQHGHWVLRGADGEVWETCWENGSKIDC